MTTEVNASSSTPSASSGKLTTHVLDTVRGGPAAGMSIRLYRQVGGAGWQLVREVATNHDGRVDGPLLAGAELSAGRYRLVFEVEAYFRAQGAALPEPAFLGQVPLEFGIADASVHYHVPLLVSPWSYSTYRGS